MERPAIFMGLSLIAGIIVGFTLNYFVLIAIAIGCLFVLISLNKSKYFSLMIICLLLFTCGLIRIVSISNSHEKMVNQLKNTNELILVITSIDSFNETIRLTGSVKSINNNPYSFFNQSKILVTTELNNSIAVGDTIWVSGKVKSIKSPTNKGQFNSKQYYYARHIRFKMYSDNIEIIKRGIIVPKRAIFSLKASIAHKISQIYKGDSKGIIQTMLLGVKSDLSNEIKAYYKVAGISHLLAISGLHVSIIGFGFIALLSKIIKNQKIVIVVAMLFLWTYCGLTGFMISTTRATLMLSIMLISKIFYKDYDSLSAIFISLMILLIYSPYQLFDVGFLLSFSAVIGIVIFSPVINQKINQGNSSVLGMLSATLAASLFTYPVIAYFFYEVPVYTIVANLVIIPFITIMIYCAILAIAISYISVYLGICIASLSVFILKYIEVICQFIKLLPYHLIVVGQPSLVMIGLFYAGLIIITIKDKNRAISYIEPIIWLSIILILMRPYIYQPEELTITQLDVGQGDSAVIEYHNKLYIIDSGGDIMCRSASNKGKSVLLPFIKSKGYDKIDGVFISHSDFDHIYGIIEIIDDIKIDFIVLPYPYKEYRDELLNQLFAKIDCNETEVYYFKQGDNYSVGQLELLCLYPSINDKKFETNNDASNILKLCYNQFTMLFTGDIEGTGEKVLVSRVCDLHVDILKIPHHGSGTSSTVELMEAVEPKMAIYSYGENNLFNHPSYEVVSRYENYNIPTFHIAKEGSVEIKVKGNIIILEGYYSKRKEIIPCKN